MSKPIKYRHRDFITDSKSADSFINAYVDYQQPMVKKQRRNQEEYVQKPECDAHIKLTDCYRSISWEFWGPEGLKKLRKTRKMLDKFFNTVELAYSYEKADQKTYIALKKESDARRKASKSKASK